MDIVLEVLDTYLFDYLYAAVLPASLSGYDSLKHGSSNASSFSLSPAFSWQYKPATSFFSLEPPQAAYMSAWTRDNIYREITSFFLITWVFGLIVYFIFASLSYVFVFDKTTFNHPKFLKNQIRDEIKQAASSLPMMAVLTVPFFVAESHGLAKLYDTTAEGPGIWYDFFQFPLFIVFTDFWIYIIHRWLHLPGVYKALHKPHHKWIMPTPYASHAFHPVDGWLQSLPYHIFPFIFPLQKFAYILLFAFVNIWTIFIHDGEYVANSELINGAACHTMHHLYFNYNYGQYTTIWDRLGGSYRKPNDELFRRETKMDKKEWEKQVHEMEKIQKFVEGDDFRSYAGEQEEKKNL